MPFHFFQLPRELRDQVYDVYLADSKIASRCDLRVSALKSSLKPLYDTSKAIRVELMEQDHRVPNKVTIIFDGLDDARHFLHDPTWSPAKTRLKLDGSLDLFTGSSAELPDLNKRLALIAEQFCMLKNTGNEVAARVGFLAGLRIHRSTEEKVLITFCEILYDRLYLDIRGEDWHIGMSLPRYHRRNEYWQLALPQTLIYGQLGRIGLLLEHY